MFIACRLPPTTTTNIGASAFSPTVLHRQGVIEQKRVSPFLRRKQGAASVQALREGNLNALHSDRLFEMQIIRDFSSYLL